MNNQSGFQDVVEGRSQTTEAGYDKQSCDIDEYRIQTGCAKINGYKPLVDSLQHQISGGGNEMIDPPIGPNTLMLNGFSSESDMNKLLEGENKSSCQASGDLNCNKSLTCADKTSMEVIRGISALSFNGVCQPTEKVSPNHLKTGTENSSQDQNIALSNPSNSSRVLFSQKEVYASQKNTSTTLNTESCDVLSEQHKFKSEVASNDSKLVMCCDSQNPLPFDKAIPNDPSQVYQTDKSGHTANSQSQQYCANLASDEPAKDTSELGNIQTASKKELSILPSGNIPIEDNACFSSEDTRRTAISQRDVTYIVYESELNMPDIIRLIQKDLSEPYSIYTYRYFIHNWPHLCFMAKVGNECVGAIVCKLDYHKKVVKRGYIAMLAVDSKYRKLKIGSTLVRKAIETMIAEEADEVVLETEITNQPALRLYENLGFVRDKRLFRYYLNGVDALRLKLWLR